VIALGRPAKRSTEKERKDQMKRLTERERARRLQELLAEEAAMPERWWWLSFKDPDLPDETAFLGAAVVVARGMLGAVRESHLLGINPGGQVAIFEITKEGAVPPAESRERLLNRDDLARLRGGNQH
jgi:hypothetical protein